jgi:hypothetical protein
MRKPVILGCGWIGLSVATLGWAPAGSRADEAPVFSHRLHLEQGAACNTCHLADEARPPSAGAAGCKDCHDQPPRFRPSAAMPRGTVEFPHPRHARALDCKTCHADIARDSGAATRPPMAFSDCRQCHAERGVSVAATRCGACHKNDPRETRPADHQRAWMEHHGPASQWRQDDHGRACDQCHGAGACAACHRTRRPNSHSSLWAMRTHGQEAEWDRDGCRTCHESGSCIRCHKTTRPLTHQGAWDRTHGSIAGVQGNQHCAVCHAAAFCRACHDR